jgi:hypothetical protein
MVQDKQFAAVHTITSKRPFLRCRSDGGQSQEQRCQLGYEWFSAMALPHWRSPDYASRILPILQGCVAWTILKEVKYAAFLLTDIGSTARLS